MEKNILLVVINIIINFFEGVMSYYLCCNLTKRYLKLSVKKVLFGILYGIALGTLASYLNVYLFKIISNIFIMFIIKRVTRKKIEDVLIIYKITFLTIVIMQIILTIFFINLSLDVVYVALLVQTFTLIGIITLSLNISLNDLFNSIQKETHLKLFIFIMLCFFLVLFGYFNFDYKNAIEYILYFSLLIFITLIGLYRTLKEIFFYANRVLHDMKNMIMGVHITACSTSNITMIRESLDQCLTIMNIDTNVKHMDVDEHNLSILSFINEKRLKNAQEIDFVADIQYYEPNVKVSLSVIIYMLGVLLDNAIESKTKKTIYIIVRASEQNITISVANEYKRKAKNDMEKMFKEGYSTKATHARGYGLSNLRKAVNKYDGEIVVAYNYEEDHKCDYLRIGIEINN